MADNKWSANQGVINTIVRFSDCTEEVAIEALEYCYHHPGAHPLAYVEAKQQNVPGSEVDFDLIVEQKSLAAWALEVRFGRL